MTENTVNEVVVNVKGCSQCGQDHYDMKFERILKPMDSFEEDNPWYAACPVRHKTVYMKFVED